MRWEDVPLPLRGVVLQPMRERAAAKRAEPLSANDNTNPREEAIAIEAAIEKLEPSR